METAEKEGWKLYTSSNVVICMNRLKELRASKNMRQTDLSKLLNVQPTTISNYELGVRESAGRVFESHYQLQQKSPQDQRLRAFSRLRPTWMSGADYPQNYP